MNVKVVDALLACGLVSSLALLACAKSNEPDGVGGQNGGSGGMTAAGIGGRTAAGGTTGAGTGGRVGGTGGQTGGGSGGMTSPGTGGSTAVACPADATFCSGFEQAGMPAGTTYRVNAAPGDWSRDFAQDTAMHNGGTASLRVKPGTEAGTSGSAYKMLAVATPPGGKFWVRFYVRSDRDLGEVDPAAPGDGLHNAFAEAAGSDDPNDGVILEFAQDAGVAFNSHDDVRWPTGFGRVGGAIVAYTLPKDTWHCIEISFDSATRVQTLFVNGAQKINATDYPMAAQVARPFASFRFGYMQFHGQPRTVWYDDVAVGPNRLPCL